MKRVLPSCLLAAFTSALSFGGSWSGFLVDSECYARQQANTRPGTHPGTVDNNRIVRACNPKDATKTFTLMETGGHIFTLDSIGNEKAHELIQKAGAVSSYKVVVSGDVSDNVLKVSTMSLGK